MALGKRTIDYENGLKQHDATIAWQAARIKQLEAEIEELKSLLSDPIQPTSAGHRVARNAPCPCGSGRKYKKCCGRRP